MTKILTFISFLLISVSVNAQIDNRWQPDSIYANRKVKEIIVFLNSPKDLSERVIFNEHGQRIKSIKYSESYNRRTRKSKKIEMVSWYHYDSNQKLVLVTDSVFHLSNSTSINKTFYLYDTSGRLVKTSYYKGAHKNPYFVKEYMFEPSRVITTQKKDSTIVFKNTKELERDFYVKKSFGYVLEPKLKRGVSVVSGDSSTYQYKDYNDLQRFENEKIISNTFDSVGKIVTSDVKLTFRHGVTEHKLWYKYYSNGLLKNIRGYVPRYFKYEFFK